jgi:hypothetical protein
MDSSAQQSQSECPWRQNDPWFPSKRITSKESEHICKVAGFAGKSCPVLNEGWWSGRAEALLGQHTQYGEVNSEKSPASATVGKLLCWVHVSSHFSLAA